VWTQQFAVVKVFFIVGLLFIIYSVASASYPLVAAKGAVNDLLLVISAVILSLYASSNLRFVNVAIAYAGLIGLGLYYFQFFVGFFAGVFSGTSIEREVLVHHFSNIRFLNHLQVLFFPFIFALSIQSDKHSIRNAATIVSVLTISILLFLSARAGLGSLCIAALIVFVVSKNYRIYVKRFFWVVFVGFTFYLICLKGFPIWWGGAEVAPVRINLNSSGRWDLWMESFELLKNNWLFGVGTLHYSFVSIYGFAHPHNLIIQIGLEYGVVVLGVFVLLATKLCFTLYKKLSITDSNTIISCFPFIWSLITIAGVSMFSGVWVAPLTQLLMVICLSPLISILMRGRFELVAESKQNKFKFEVLGVRALLLISAFFLIVLVYPDFELRYKGNGSFMQAKGVQVFAPRFWQEDIWPDN
tara:strand:+ start:10723 stop:11964 length:1242 start_codon:yes stop_codon:yes gene_type:complete